MKQPLSMAFVLFVTLAGSRAHAQPHEDTERARTLFEESITAIGEGRYAIAVTSLQQSLALAPRAATAFNLAVALRGVGRFTEATRVIVEVLDGAYGELDSGQRAQAVVLRDEVEDDRSTLVVHVENGRDVRIAVDGVHATTVSRPPGDAIIVVDPGEHHVTAHAIDYEATELTASSARGERVVLTLTLEATRDTRPGILDLRAESEEEVLVIDGVAEGRGRLVRRLPPAEYVVSLRHGDSVRETRVTVVAGRRIQLTLSPPSTSIWSNAWFWTGVGVVVAGLAALAVGIAFDSRGERTTDPIWGVVEAFSIGM